MSAAQRRNQSNAAKAMKISYNQGIPLKKAWKMVKSGKH
jgi:hypothetical protein